jgi:nucleoid DNA-binding protein
MTKKERNQQEIIYASDLFRLTKSAIKEQGYDLSIEEVRAVIDSMVHIIYTCLLNGIRVTIPNLGEFYRDIKKGRKAGYYNVPSSRDAHTKFDKNMVWTKEYMEQAPDWGRIMFVEKPSVKKKFREETTGKV